MNRSGLGPIHVIVKLDEDDARDQVARQCVTDRGHADLVLDQQRAPPQAELVQSEHFPPARWQSA